MLEDEIKRVLEYALEDLSVDKGRYVLCYLKGALEKDYPDISNLLGLLLDKTRDGDHGGVK